MNWYYTFLVRRPFLMVLGVGVFSLACIIVALTTKNFPDFTDPTAGFEARGTSIGQRLNAWKNLLEKTGPSRSLVADPNEYFQEQDFRNSLAQANKKKNRNRNKPKNKKNEEKKRYRDKIKALKEFSNNASFLYDAHFKDYEISENTTSRTDHWDYGRNTSYVDEDDNRELIQLKKNKWMSVRNLEPTSLMGGHHVASAGYFCDSPNKEYCHFVVQSKYNASDTLFEINSLLAICELEHHLSQIETYKQLCQTELNSSRCCKSWSIPNYIALLSNKSSCYEINKEDVTIVGNLLIHCFEYFQNFKLNEDCLKHNCIAPAECTRHNAVYDILHYLSDMDFLKNNNSKLFLNSSMIFLPIGKSTKVIQFYYNYEKSDLQNKYVEISAMDMGLKNALFDEYLVADGWLLILGAIFVVVCMWLYTTSLFVTIMTMVAVVFSLGIAYFIYTLVFEISFFPFMNVLVVVILIGIGADDAFIFVKIWQCTAAERMKSGGGPSISSPSTSFSDSTYKETLNSLMASTLKHAAISMFVTSLTTAAAFYASITSSITAIKCFGIFAGTTILANYLLMITWLPASVSIMERIPFNFEYCIAANLSQKLHKSINKIGTYLENFVLSAVMKAPLFWVVFFGLIGIMSSIVVLYYPSVQLPDSQDFQLFDSDHPFELYETKFRDKFWFEKLFPSIDNFKLPLRFVWGILPIDNGNYLDPSSRGDLYFDNNFNISSVESQKWLFGFCRRLKLQPFYQLTFGLLLPNCFIENFISWMNRRCVDPMDDVDRSPCCETSKFPFEPHIFEKCLPLSISALYLTPREFFMPGVAGPKFGRSTNIKENVTASLQVKAIVIEYESNVSFSFIYSDIQQFVIEVETWFNNEIKTAPSGMTGGWFISELDFYDLQDTLSNGTVISIVVSMVVSLVVLFLVTLSVLVSLYSVITMTFTIFTIVAVLILLGWKLNILESISVSTAMGLAIDYCLHYGIHYRLSSNSDRESATTFALTRMIGPTAMAAVTTAAAGAFMLASSVLPYTQIGVFLVVVIIISWLYSTFFLMSLLKMIGPQYGFLQFSYPKLSRQRKNNGNTKEFRERSQNNIVASEQLLTPSSSAVGDLINSESHELDSLTSNSLIKPTNMSDIPRTSEYEHVFNRISSLSKDYRSPSTGSAVTVVLAEDPDGKI